MSNARMNPIASTPTHVDNRQLSANELADSLMATRQRTLGLVQAWHSALPTLQVLHSPELNPPLWELGHVGWFQEWWIGRNQHRTLGLACDPDHDRFPSHLAGADALYNSSRVPHASRWHPGRLHPLSAHGGRTPATGQRGCGRPARRHGLPQCTHCRGCRHTDTYAPAPR